MPDSKYHYEAVERYLCFGRHCSAVLCSVTLRTLKIYGRNIQWSCSVTVPCRAISMQKLLNWKVVCGRHSETGCGVVREHYVSAVADGTMASCYNVEEW